MPDKGLIEGMPSLIILLFGLNLISIYVPFDNLMVASGRPAYQTIQQLFTVGMNVLVASACLPILGIEGAAIGTAVSYLSGITMLIIFRAFHSFIF